MEAKTTPRQRAREQTIRDIKRLARAQLATEGSGALSLRAIARDLGIVSSAIYRYVPSRDELLTMLIVDAYDGVGAAVEKAEAEPGRSDFMARWLAAGGAFRTWALRNAESFSLIYGSPVPGYAAPPERTSGPGTRVSLLILRLVTEAEEAGAAKAPYPGPPIPEDLRPGFAGLREEFETTTSDDLIVRATLAWTSLVGLVNFELTHQFRGLITDDDAHFDLQLRRLGGLLGLNEEPVAP